MQLERRGTPANRRPYYTIGAIVAAQVLALTGIWLWAANINPDVNVPEPVLPSPNAYDDYVAAAELLVRSEDVTEAASLSPQKVYTLEQEDALVRANQPALARLRQGFAHEYHEPPARSSTTVVMHYKGVRELKLALSLEGKVKAAHGDHAGAVDSYLDVLRLGQDVRKGGALLSGSVGMAIQAVGRQPAWDTIDHLDGPGARRALRRMEEIDAREVPFADTLREEMWSGQRSLVDLFRKNEQWKSSRLLGDEMSPQSVRDDVLFGIRFQFYGKRRIMDDYTKYMEASIALASRPYSVSVPYPAVPSDPINQLMAPDFSRARFKYVSNRTQNALLTVSLALRAYRVERGRYPESLAQLSPDYLTRIPDDPFRVGTLLCYRRTSTGYCLYSVGPDARDDGGKPIVHPLQGSKSRKRYWVEPESIGDIVSGTNNVD